MNYFLLIFASLALLTCGTRAQSNIWNGLRPLYSTRSNVENRIGKPDKIRAFSGDQYTVGSDVALIKYAKKHCEQGWDVPVDTVLEIKVSRKGEVGKNFEELGLKKEGLFVSVDDAFYALWMQPILGHTYYFGNVDQSLRYVGFIPTRSDNTRRCDGFPDYVPEASNYLMLEDFSFYKPRQKKLQGFNDILSKIDTFIYERKNRSEGKYRGYVVIYFDNSLSLKEYKSRYERIKRHIFALRKESITDFEVIEGGYREESKVELYLLTRDQKPPAPDPSLPSPQFTRKTKTFKSK